MREQAIIQTIGSRIKAARERKGWTIHDFYQALLKSGERITKQSLRNWESGDYPPSSKHIPILAKALGVDSSYFFESE